VREVREGEKGESDVDGHLQAEYQGPRRGRQAFLDGVVIHRDGRVAVDREDLGTVHEHVGFRGFRDDGDLTTTTESDSGESQENTNEPHEAFVLHENDATPHLCGGYAHGLERDLPLLLVDRPLVKRRRADVHDGQDLAHDGAGPSGALVGPRGAFRLGKHFLKHAT